MREIIQILAIALVVASLALLPARVQAACQVEVCEDVPEVCFGGVCEPNYCFNCAGSGDVGTCPPNYHLTNRGCIENGTGQDCPCGLWSR